MSLSLSLEVDGRRGFCGAPGHTLPRVLIVGTGDTYPLSSSSSLLLMLKHPSCRTMVQEPLSSHMVVGVPEREYSSMVVGVLDLDSSSMVVGVPERDSRSMVVGWLNEIPDQWLWGSQSRFQINLTQKHDSLSVPGCTRSCVDAEHCGQTCVTKS